ncbi:LOW QUALITY PROTEIN: galanin receptor type 2-like [Porphyrio hochstetteri]
MEEDEEDNFVLSLRINSSKCSLMTNQTGAPPCWSGATRGGPEVVIVPVLFGLIFILQTVLLVVPVFLLSWLPYHIIMMWAEFGQFPLNNISFTFCIISHCLAYGNSCINPIIYAFLSENFHKTCRQVFTCKFFLRSVPETLVRICMENFSTTHSTTNI